MYWYYQLGGKTVKFLRQFAIILKLTQVKDAADFLIEIMPVMFIPAAAGLLESWAFLKPIWGPVAFITVLTTIIVMAVTGRVTQYMIRRGHNTSKGESL